jgi:undecaprenyl phosphate N,N'-diacetylbacillosamine 1-phosphate transferase
MSENLYRKWFKPTVDFILAAIFCVILAPFALLAVLLLTIANRGEIFYIQARPGKDERLFNLIKFKTMNDRRDENGELLPDDQRLTWAGKVIRKTSLDELPQLINVLKGEMSLIGPRPWLTEYLPLYSSEQRRRHAVKPGITGWAQVNGRNAVSWQERFNYDLYYVDHLSFSLDLKILMLTIWKILRADGISGEGTMTMKKFQGHTPGSEEK